MNPIRTDPQREISVRSGRPFDSGPAGPCPGRTGIFSRVCRLAGIMKRSCALPLWVVLIFSPACMAAAAQTSVEAQIRQLNEREVAGLMHQDVKALAPLWSDQFVVTNPYNRFVTKKDVVDFVASGRLGFRDYDRRIEYIHVYGDTVVVAGSETVAWAGRMPLAGKTSLLRFTSVWMRHGDSWQEVARHANIVWTR